MAVVVVVAKVARRNELLGTCEVEFLITNWIWPSACGQEGTQSPDQTCGNVVNVLVLNGALSK